MKNLFFSAAVAAAALSTQAVTISVIPASAPNSFGSPSYAAWEANAISALHSGSATAGVAGTPTYYSQAPGTMNVSDNIVTGFPSWKSQADPATVFGPGFASELGNRLLFGLKIDGQGTQFSISQLSFVGDSTDPDDSLDFAFGQGSYNYGSGYVGVLFGADQAWGGGDDIFITSGPSTQLVDGLIGRGSGNAWAVYDTDTGATRQDKINNALANPDFANEFFFTGTYTLSLQSGDVTGSASVKFNGVPDAGASALLIALSAGALGLFQRRNKR